MPSGTTFSIEIKWFVSLSMCLRSKRLKKIQETKEKIELVHSVDLLSHKIMQFAFTFQFCASIEMEFSTLRSFSFLLFSLFH